MKFDIITIFPRIFDSYFSESILNRAQKNDLIKIETHDLRAWTEDKHKKVDDSPFGGGPGMIFKVEPIFKAVTALKSVKSQVTSGTWHVDSFDLPVSHPLATCRLPLATCYLRLATCDL